VSQDPSPDGADESKVKAAELEVRRLEAQKAVAGLAAPWWRRADPLVVAIVAGALTLLGNMAATLLNGYWSLKLEQKKGDDDLALEQSKANYSLVLQAIATNDDCIAKRNIDFFIDADLLKDPGGKIRTAIERDRPVLPSLSGKSPPSSGSIHSAPEIAKAYNFPDEFDGRGVTIGILEFGGSVVRSDVEAYFKSLDLPAPDLTSVLVDEVHPAPDEATDAQVMLDVEIAGAIAPRAPIRVYFASFTSAGFAHAVQRAITDGVAVLSVGWGQPESKWTDQQMEEIDAALKQAADHNVTVLAAAGGQGVTDGLADGKRHVDFPASSAWVLAVGGTTLKSQNGRILSETVWKSGTVGATGGGVSEKFDRPDWQSAISTPNRFDGKPGRGVPDVVASADPEFGVMTVVHGLPTQIGGTSSSAPVWAGLIARIDQALGYNVGYLNRRLYESIGPSGVLRAVTSGDNTFGGVAGYSAGPGWSPVAGWGSPDGRKLLDWLREHPNPPPGKQFASVVCPNSK